MMTESERTRVICEQVRARGWIALTLHGGSVHQTPGMPDRWFACCDAVRSWHGYVEFKGPDGTLSAAQRQLMRRMRTIDKTSAYVARFHGRHGGPIGLEDADGQRLGETLEECGVELLEKIMGWNAVVNVDKLVKNHGVVQYLGVPEKATWLCQVEKLRDAIRTSRS
jgi:hypothetical protein